jgi:acyl-homoserine-lactone acylase
VETSLAVNWGEALWAKVAPEAKRAGIATYDYMATRATPAEKLDALAEATDRLTQDFGSWKVPWGQINRFQRITDDIVPHFDDAGPSIPVPFASAQWGSLASFGAKRYPDTKKYYGSNGNSFVAVVEFGDRRGLLLSRPARWAHRADVPPRRIGAQSETQAAWVTSSTASSWKRVL